MIKENHLESAVCSYQSNFEQIALITTHEIDLTAYACIHDNDYSTVRANFKRIVFLTYVLLLSHNFFDFFA